MNPKVGSLKRCSEQNAMLFARLFKVGKKRQREAFGKITTLGNETEILLTTLE